MPNQKISLRSRLLVVLLACLTMTLTAAAGSGSELPAAFAKSNAYGAYMKIDGRWYGITSTDLWDYDPLGMTLFVDDTTATNCRRANGQFPSVGGTSSVLFGVGSPSTSFFGSRITGGEAFTIRQKTHPDLPLILEIYSLDTDVRCTGEVAAPNMTPPVETPIFVNQFE